MSYNPYGHQPYQQFARSQPHRPGDYLKASLVASQQKEEAEKKLQEMQRKANQKVKLEERKRKILLQKQRMKEQQARKAALKKGKQLGGAGGVVSGPPGIVVSAPTPSLGQVFSADPPEASSGAGATSASASSPQHDDADASSPPSAAAEAVRTKPSRFGVSAPATASTSAGATASSDPRLAQAQAMAAALQQQLPPSTSTGGGDGTPQATGDTAQQQPQPAAKRTSKWDQVDPSGASQQNAALVSAQLRAAQQVASKIAAASGVQPTSAPNLNLPEQRDEDGEVIPPAPTDIGIMNAIHNLVDFVAKNGVQFEEVVRAKNRDSKNFRFLFDMLTPEYLYYKYKLRRAQKKHEEAENREMVKRALNRGGGSGGYGGSGSSSSSSGGYGGQDSGSGGYPSGGSGSGQQSGGYPSGGYPSGGQQSGAYPPPPTGGYPPPPAGGYNGGNSNGNWDQPQQPPVSQGGYNGSGSGGYPQPPPGGPSPTSNPSKRKKSKWDEGPGADDTPSATAEPFQKVRRGFHDGPPPSSSSASASHTQQQQQPDLDSLDEQEFSRARSRGGRDQPETTFTRSYNNAPPPASLSAVPPPRSLSNNSGPRGRFSSGHPSSSSSSGGSRQFSVLDQRSRRRSRSRSPRRDAPDHSSAPPKRRRFSERQGDASADAYSPEGAFAGAPGGAGGSPPAEESDSLAKMEWFASQADKSQQRDYVPTPEEDKPAPDSKSHSGHHISHFLPPEEAAKFEAPSGGGGGRQAPARSAKHKLGADNKGYQMLVKSGWKKGSGLGAQGGGNDAPIEAHNQRWENQGVGAGQTNVVDNEDDEFARYKKKMMTAYKYRPNPMNNPRKPYY